MVAQKYTDRQKPRILFVHNTLMWYTKPFFMRLSQIYDTKFIFTHVSLSKDVYGIDTSAEVEGFGGIKYKVVKRYFKNMSPSGIPLGLIRDLFQERYDIVVATPGSIEMLFCFLAARLRSKPIAGWSEEWGWKGKSSKKSLASLLTRFIVARSDAILVPGTKHREYFVSLGASSDKVFIVPNASNIIVREEDYKEKENLRKRLNIGTRKVILYVGRLVKRKGVEYLVEAFSRLKKERDDIVLVITGRGESRAELESLSKSLNIQEHVCFTGYVEDELLPAYYLLCDICVVPSITYEMGDPWVFILNEAMYFGKPVIATDAVGAAYDMIKDGINGFMVPERDSDSLYKAMKTILFDPELARKMGEESKKIVEQGFAYEHMIQGFSRAVESISRGI